MKTSTLFEAYAKTVWFREIAKEIYARTDYTDGCFMSQWRRHNRFASKLESKIRERLEEQEA